jgi:hypothetical protein
MSDRYNLERQHNIENNIDPTGKKWEIYHIKGSALYECRPNPYNPQTTIPDEFKGRWTKHTLLQDQILLFLNRAWDKAEKEAQKLERKNQATKESKAKKAPKKTAKESLDELPDEIKNALGDTIATEE